MLDDRIFSPPKFIRKAIGRVEKKRIFHLPNSFQETMKKKISYRREEFPILSMNQLMNRIIPKENFYPIVVIEKYIEFILEFIRFCIEHNDC